MSESVYDFLHDRWREYKRRLHRLCILTHAQALLDAICPCVPEQDGPWLARAVATWIDQHVGRDLEQRIRTARDDGPAAPGPEYGTWSQLLRLFASPERMAGQIGRSRDLICAAWNDGDDDRARAILWQTLTHYFYEVRFEIDGPTGQHRLRNWERIRRLKQQVTRDWEARVSQLSGPEHHWAVQRLADPARLAAEILARSQQPGARWRLDDVATVEGVLAYLYAFQPHLDIGDMDGDPALVADLPSDLAETVNYYIDDPESPAGLTPAERAALILEFREGVPPMSDRAFQDTYGHTRQTHRNRVRAGIRKIAPWVRRDLETGGGKA